jgi:hypothetical protein
VPSLLGAVVRSLAVLLSVAVVTAAVVVLTDRGSPVMIDPAMDGDPPPAPVEETTAEGALAVADPPEPGSGREAPSADIDETAADAHDAGADADADIDEEDPLARTGAPSGDGRVPAPQTTVQVLDGGGGATAVAEVVALVEAAGYEVVAVNAARCCYDATTALWSAGREAIATGLAAAIDGVVEVRENPNLSQEVDVHIVVGVDWAD